MAVCPRCKNNRGCACSFKKVLNYPVKICNICVEELKKLLPTKKSNS
jgi:hypothetical protein